MGIENAALRLEAIEVDLPNRPKQKLKVDVAVDDKSLSREFSERDALCLEPSFVCKFPLNVSVRIHTKGLLRKYKQYARVTSRLASIDGATAVLEDERQKVRIKLTFSNTNASNSSDDSVESTLPREYEGVDSGPSSSNQIQDPAARKEKTASCQSEEMSESSVRDSELGQRLKTGRKNITKQDVVLDKLQKVRGPLEFLREVGGAAAELNPYAKLAFTAMDSLYKVCVKQEQCRDAAVELIDQLDTILSLTHHVSELQERNLSREAAAVMLHLIKDISDYFCENAQKADLLRTAAHKKKLEIFKKEFRMAKEQFDRNVQVETLRMVFDLLQRDTVEARRRTLQEVKHVLKFADEATYDPKGQCLKGTRTSLRRMLVQWGSGNTEVDTMGPVPRNSVPEASETNFLEGADAVYDGISSKNIVWLYGLAGSGKSTVANTVAVVLKEHGCNVSSFFCKRDKQNDWSTASRVLLMLASQIAECNLAYADTLTEVLNSSKRDNMVKGEVDTQVQELFSNALPRTSDSSLPHVIVIDALDECAGSHSDIIDALVAIVTAAPWINVFLTSRYSREIDKSIGRKTGMCHSMDISKIGQVDGDIRFYANWKLRELRKKLEEDDEIEVLNEEQISAYTEGLSKKAGKLFIWISTVFRYLDKSTNPVRDIKKLLSEDDRRPTVEPLQPLYDLYYKVLEAAPFNGYDLKLMHHILEVVFITASTSPLSIRAIAAILQGKSEEDIMTSAIKIIHSLRAVVYEDEENGGMVRAYHLSFLDFLGMKAKEIDRNRVHKLMFESCLSIMLRNLKFNICGLEDAFVMNRDVADLEQRILKNILPELDYGCLYWMTHLLNSGLNAIEVQGKVKALLCNVRLLFWLEVLGITGAVERSIPILQRCLTFFASHDDIARAANDVQIFVSSLYQAMVSMPHLYISALSWVPSSTFLRKLLEEKFEHRSLIGGWPMQNWDSNLGMKRFNKRVSAVAYSPDGLLIAVGIVNDIHLLDAATRQAKRSPLHGHSGKVVSIAFSWDGKHFASGSWDRTVRIWDLATGQAVGKPLQGHLGPVTSIAYSYDGLRLVSGSWDGTIRLWDARSGQFIGEPWQGHSGKWVTSVAFSTDGTRVVSGSNDHTLRIWNAGMGEPVGGPLQKHSNAVTSVAISPDGTRIASSSCDSTIRLWSLSTGEPLREPLSGHTGFVDCIAFSADGTRIVSGSHDHTVRVWDAQTGRAIGIPLRGHTRVVTSVTFSPDGAHILSGSIDGTVRIWSLRTSEESESRLVHSDTVYSVVFTTDGTRIISGSGDGTVRIWDAQTGDAVGVPLRGHSKGVRSLTVCPDGSRIASGSDDKTVRIWDFRTGEPIGKPLRGRSEVTSVAYSHDGARIVSGSHDKTMIIWDASASKPICRPLRGHCGWICSVALSPDDSYIASGSGDRTIRFWDSHSGELIGEPLCGHTSAVRTIAFSPDGSYLASGSEDGTVRLWNTITRDTISILAGQFSTVLSVTISGVGSQIAIGTARSTVHIWDMNTRKPIGEPLRCHYDSVWDAVWTVAFSPDGSRMASGSDDKNIFISTLMDPERENWNQSCRKIDLIDGWVKDGEKLLLWIPDRHRRRFQATAEVGIGENIQERVLPKVDLEVLTRYSGTRWTDIYKGDK